MSGNIDDADDALIDESTLFQIMDSLDIDGDGDVSKDEFMVPWMKLFPKLHRADYDRVWLEIDKDGSGTLSLPELAEYYGFNLSPSAKRKGDQTANMTDEQIMEALPHVLKAPPLAVPEVGSCSNAFPGRAWQLWLARRAQGRGRPTPPPSLRLGCSSSPPRQPPI